MAHKLTSFALLVLLSLSWNAAGRRFNRPMILESPSKQPSSMVEEKLIDLPAMVSPADSSEVASEAPKQFAGVGCETAIAEKSIDVMGRLQAYFGKACNVQATMLGPEPTYELAEEGLEAICKPLCFTSPELSTPLLGIDDILSRCSRSAGIEIFQTTVAMVRAMDAGRETCNPEEYDDIAEEALQGAEPVPVPPRGMIAALKLNIQLMNALAIRGDPDCESLKKVFREFDYRRTGYLTMDDFNKVLSALSESQKQESRLLFEDYLGEQDAVGFTEIVHTKLDIRAAMKCALEYATRPPTPTK